MSAVCLAPPDTTTLRYFNITTDALLENEVIICASTAIEDRGEMPLWKELATTNPNRIILATTTADSDSVELEYCGNSSTHSLRDELLLQDLELKDLLIDISGLPHNVWAPLFKSAHHLNLNTRILYAEPSEYKLHDSPASNTLFDLSEGFEGLSPLPGFAKLGGPDNENETIFVALLGFEGNRPERLIYQVEPTPKVIPVIGVPGFQLEYPTYTVTCNRSFLSSNDAHSEIRFARASCPFAAYNAIAELRRDYPNHYLYIAPVGTKPHSLGAIKYALDHPDHSEILFDNPIRKSGRTKGVGLMHIYDYRDNV